MSLSSVGKIDVFADTGLDEWEILKNRISAEIKNKKIKDGDYKTMRVDFGEPMIISITVNKMPQEKLL